MTSVLTNDNSSPIPGAPLYQLKGVTRTFTKGGITVNALRGINIDIARGETVSLEGPSGSGKTTLLQLLGALDTPSAGQINFAGRFLEDASDDVLTDIRSREIGFVFQQFNLIPTLSAQENVAIAMVPRESSNEKRIERASELLGQVGLENRLGQLPSRLSGGEQQRVAIARALANSPRSSSPMNRRATLTPRTRESSWPCWTTFNDCRVSQSSSRPMTRTSHLTLGAGSVFVMG